VGTTLTRDGLLHLASGLGKPRRLPRSQAYRAERLWRAGDEPQGHCSGFGDALRDGTGLSGRNVFATADLAKLVQAAHATQDPRLHDLYSHQVKIGAARCASAIPQPARSSHWDIGLSKTGYIAEAGRCS